MKILKKSKMIFLNLLQVKILILLKKSQVTQQLISEILNTPKKFNHIQ